MKHITTGTALFNLMSSIGGFFEHQYFADHRKPPIPERLLHEKVIPIHNFILKQVQECRTIEQITTVKNYISNFCRLYNGYDTDVLCAGLNMNADNREHYLLTMIEESNVQL